MVKIIYRNILIGLLSLLAGHQVIGKSLHLFFTPHTLSSHHHTDETGLSSNESHCAYCQHYDFTDGAYNITHLHEIPRAVVYAKTPAVLLQHSYVACNPVNSFLRGPPSC